MGGRTKSSLDFEHHLTELGLDMEEIEIGPSSPWLHKRISDFEADAAGRVMPVAILRKEGGTDLNPGPTAMLMPGDALVVLKRVARR